MTDRKTQLTALLAKQPNDPFLVYALAMEDKKNGNHADALTGFDRVTQLDPGYAYAFHQQGLIHEGLGNTAAARTAYERGIAAATAKGDAHARGEIEAAMDLLV